MSLSTDLAVASTVLTDPTVLTAIVASIAMVAFVAIMVFIALAPHVSPTWATKFGNHSIDDHAVSPQEAD